MNDAIAPMEVVPGSHRMHHRNTFLIDTLEQNHSVKVLTRRGDCILRDGNMLHRGTPNLTGEARIMLDQTYRAIED